jgi:hypothetical protein
MAAFKGGASALALFYARRSVNSHTLELNQIYDFFDGCGGAHACASGPSVVPVNRSHVNRFPMISDTPALNRSASSISVRLL